MSDHTAAADRMELCEEAEGKLAEAQDWTCPACGMTIAGGCGTLTFTRIPSESSPVAVIMHEQCIDDTRRTPRLADIPELAARAGAGDEDAARKARNGAIGHARIAIMTPIVIAETAKKRAELAAENYQHKHDGGPGALDGAPTADRTSPWESQGRAAGRRSGSA